MTTKLSLLLLLLAMSGCAATPVAVDCPVPAMAPESVRTPPKITDFAARYEILIADFWNSLKKPTGK